MRCFFLFFYLFFFFCRRRWKLRVETANEFAHGRTAGQQQVRRSPQHDSVSNAFDSLLVGRRRRPIGGRWRTESKSMGKKVRIRARTRRYDVIQLKKLPLCNPICRSRQRRPRSMPVTLPI